MSRFHRIRRRHAAALPIGLVAVIALTTNALGAYWTPTEHLSHSPNVFTTDLSANGRYLVAGWLQGSGDNPETWVSESSDSGNTFGPPVRLAVDHVRVANQLSLDSGAGQHWAVWSEDGPNHDHIFVASKPFGHGTWQTVPLANRTQADSPDIAVSGSRVFVGYGAHIGSGTKLLVQSEQARGGTFGEPVSIATSPGVFAIDAAPDAVFVVWGAGSATHPLADGPIRLKRGLIGHGPEHDVSWQPTKTLATGRGATVVVGGSRVAVSYLRGANVWVRTSSDGGTSFGTEMRLLEGGAAAASGEYSSVDAAIDGTRIVIEAGGFAGIGNGFVDRATSNDGGRTWAIVRDSREYDARQVAFIRVGGLSKICQLWSGSGPGGRGVVEFHRQG